jgi:transcriptional regulator with GAF, ATPase, and Fis domain
MMINAHLSEEDFQGRLFVLSRAALFDGEFNIDWLQELTGKKASAIFTALEFGVEKGWLSRNNLTDFSFIDAAEQNKLVSAIPPADRESLHRNISRLLLGDLSEDSKKTRQVARHLLHISNDDAGCRLLIENGNIHRRQFRDEEARLYYDKAIDDLRQLATPEADRLFTEATLEYAKVSTDSDNPNRVIAILREAIRRAESCGDSGSIGFLEMHLGKSQWLSSRYSSALSHFRQGWELARTIDDPAIQKSATIFGIFFHYWSGRYKEVVRIYETLVPEVEDQFPKNRLPLLAALTAGVCLGHTGLYSQGLGMLDAIRVRSRAIGNLSMAGLAGVSLGHLLLELHRPEDAISCIEESWDEIKKSKSIYARLGALALLSYAHHQAGDPAKAISNLKEYCDLSVQSQMTVKFTALWMMICKDMEDGSFPRMEGLSLDDEIRYSLESGNLFMKGVAFRHKALMMRNSGHSSRDILQTLKQSMADLETCGHQIELAKSKLEVAREYLRMGSEKEYIEYAEPAARTLYAFNEILVPGDIRPLVKDLRYGRNLLDEILRLSQELTTIRDYRELSRRIISAINRITGAERGAIFVLEGERAETVILKAAKNLTSEDVTVPHFDRSMRLIEKTARTGKGHIMELDHRNSDQATGGGAIRSCICVPLKMRHKVTGVLYHDNRLFRSAFKESDLEILNYFATQAAIAMDNAEAWEALQNLYEKQQLEKEHYEKEYLETIHFEDFVGQSPAIKKVFSQAEQVAQTDATVLILGETGVGKELVARSIHHHSHRAEKPFIRVDCSALSESLISSELFGHEKGAFTGATARHIGRFELANGGTIFLDEIGDISMDIQVKLLRVLQSREFVRVGGDVIIQSDFRLLAATNRNLEQEVKKGRFRRDLYYRLNVFPIHVPSLRDRKEDVPLLARYFLGLYANKCNKPLDKISPPEMEKLMSYDWPGNVRELENVIERGVILSNGPFYRVPELASRHSLSHDTHMSLRENELNHILEVLRATGGKVTGHGGAAEILDIHPNTLFSRMKKLGISRKASYLTGDTDAD